MVAALWIVGYVLGALLLADLWALYGFRDAFRLPWFVPTPLMIGGAIVLWAVVLFATMESSGRRGRR